MKSSFFVAWLYGKEKAILPIVRSSARLMLILSVYPQFFYIAIFSTSPRILDATFVVSVTLCHCLECLFSWPPLPQSKTLNNNRSVQWVNPVHGEDMTRSSTELDTQMWWPFIILWPRIRYHYLTLLHRSLSTMIQNLLKSGRYYWTTRSSACSFAWPAHLLTCSSKLDIWEAISAKKSWFENQSYAKITRPYTRHKMRSRSYWQ